MYPVSNPLQLDLDRPLVYLIRITSPTREYRYVGKSSSRSRFEKAYQRNVRRIFEGKPKRPAVKRDGSPQSEHNLRYRWVHLALARAVEEGWTIEQFPVANAPKGTQLNATEQQKIREFDCNLNSGPSWFIEDYSRYANQFS